ncbi:MAG: TlpA family protein disulfide reductase [Polaromonas sp.]|nr:TlpA family protein disulfide reductase [Polaromonas sp.]
MSDLSFPRRRLLQGVLAAAGAAALPALAAQALSPPGFDVSDWPGPLADFSLLDTAGKTWRPSDLRGRAVLLNFWATWCPPCRIEMPSLQQVADFYGADKLLVLAINFKEPAARAVKFATATGLTLPVLLDTDGRAARQWGVNVCPTTLMLDHRGQARQRVRGEVDWSGRAAEKLLQPLLK